MNEADEAARKAYLDAGVNLPELKQEGEEPKPKAEEPAPKPAAEDKPDTEDKPKVEEKSEDKALLKDEPQPPRKRSIYDDYKDKKKDLADEKTLRETAERERDDLKARLDALGTAETPKEKQDAQDEIDSFITTHKEWDKAAITDLVALVRKGVTPQTDDTLKKGIEGFQQWQQSNSAQLEKAAFETEFTAATPKLKELFPTASPEEFGAIKAEIDTISHSKDWHDKSLAYVAFEHRDTLSALISPKKRGIEGAGRKTDAEVTPFEFDPNAEWASMKPADQAAWEKAYREAGKSEGLSTGANGKKMIL